MKTIRIILLVLIIVGLGLLATQKFWLAPLVDQILEWQGVSNELTAYVPTENDILPGNASSSSEQMSDWNWVNGEAGANKTQFSYPNPLPTTYVTAVDWPPQVTVTTEPFDCKATPNANGGTIVDRRTIHDREYCVTVSGEGAAGSTFTKYTYSAKEGDVVETVYFILRTPQCMNYDDPKQSDCNAEQAEFDVDALAARISESITLY
jgi:hypothetical protein